MTSTRTIASVTGWLFLVTFITSIPAAFVFYPSAEKTLRLLRGVR